MWRENVLTQISPVFTDILQLEQVGKFAFHEKALFSLSQNNLSVIFCGFTQPL
jgi:hypothetical protein